MSCCFTKAVGVRWFISQPLGSVHHNSFIYSQCFNYTPDLNWVLPSQSLAHESGCHHLHKLKPGSNSSSESYAPFVLLPGITMSGVRSAGELLISQPHCWTHVLVSCTIQLDLVGAKSLISCSALKRPKPLLTVKLARLPPVFLIIARVQTKSLWRAGLKPCDFF